MATVEIPMDDGTLAVLRLPENLSESDAERISNVVAALADVEWEEEGE